MKPLVASFDEAVARYGKPWDGPAAYHTFENEWMRLWEADKWAAKTGRAWNLPFKRIYCNRDLLEPLDQTFLVLDVLGLLDELETFDGCLNVRPIRGTEANPRWSMHSFGIAVDFNAATNPLGGPVKFSPRFVQAWKLCGWNCGAYFDRVDGMHFEWIGG